jgi:uncharacterized protein (TIGR00730 family)
MKEINKSKTDMKARDAWQVMKMQSELIHGFEVLSDLDKSVAIFGSARLKPDNKHYILAEEIAFKLSSKGYAIITGGGNCGIMQSANKGGKEGGSPSVGVGIQLPYEQGNNSYIDPDKNLQVNYFAVRNFLMLKYAHAVIAVSGGYGTLYELFQSLTLKATGKMENCPIILVGSDFWSGCIEWLKTTLINEGVISEKDLDLFRVVDTADEVVEKMEEYFNKYNRENDTNF